MGCGFMKTAVVWHKKSPKTEAPEVHCAQRDKNQQTKAGLWLHRTSAKLFFFFTAVLDWQTSFKLSHIILKHFVLHLLF